MSVSADARVDNKRRSSHHRLESLCAFESKLIDLFGAGDGPRFEHGDIRIGLEREGSAGEVTLALVAQEMRDFCLLEMLDDVVLGRFAHFFLASIGKVNATRARLGPLSKVVAMRLESLLQGACSSFVFHDAILAVEPLIKKEAGHSTSSSLRRALRKGLVAGFQISSECLSVPEMTRLHSDRWGANRTSRFFEAMGVFAKEPYCDCISITDSSGNILGQQLDFCISDERRFYYSIANHSEFPGVGTALLAESIRRFLAKPELLVYSFGRGGEHYKYRYANRFRLNHYVLGFRVNGREEI
jgi:hypothetical protein